VYAATWARRLRGARPSRFIIVPIGFGGLAKGYENSDCFAHQIFVDISL